MKINYLGHFADYSGMGRTARDYVEILEGSGHDVRCIIIDQHQKIATWGEKWVQRALQGTDYHKEPDIFLVHKTPWENELLHELPPAINAKKKIFWTVFETDRWPEEWKEALSHFDMILTPSTWQMNAAKKILPEKKIAVIPHPISPTLDYEMGPHEDFVFYSDFSRVSHRKGVDILLKAYFMAFTASDKVILRIKIPNRDADKKRFAEIYKQAKNCFNFKEIPRIQLNDSFLTDEHMLDNILDCDAYICSARGEGFAMGLATAAVNGKPCLAPGFSCQFGSPLTYTWHKDFLSFNCHYFAEETQVVTDEFHDLGMKIDTNLMEWLEPDIKHLAESMKDLSITPIDCIPDKTCIEYLSNKNVANLFESALNSAMES